MQFSELWLRTMCNPPVDSAELCERLTMAGLEVEEAKPAAPPFTGVVVAEDKDSRVVHEYIPLGPIFYT